jgi:5'-AMP-activated protein kinase regulatory gamma subunit
VLPISYRLIILDTALRVQKSLNILIQNGTTRDSKWGTGD